MKYGNWRFISSGYADAYTNMAIDEAIMTAYQNGLVPPTLRLYQWNPPGVSIGYFQKIEDAVNIEACKSLRVDAVRRLTGGRAVLHEHELTYSVVIGEDYPGMPQSVVESYKFICMGIMEGLKVLGVDIALKSGKSKAPLLNSAACFDSASMYEVLWQGKKLVGSAQIRKNGVILQHGSVLMDIDIEKQVKVLNSKNKFELNLKHVFENRVTTLKKGTGRQLKVTEIEQAIFNGFEQAFGIAGKPDELINRELDRVNSNLLSKYKSYEWINMK